MTRVLNLLQFSDPHLFADSAAELRGVRTLESLQQSVATAMDLHGVPDAFLVTGDIAQDETATAYGHLRDCFSGLGAPVCCLPGNHDNPSLMRELLDTAPFQYCGHLLSERWLIINLDSRVDGAAHGHLGVDELRRLSLLLADNPAKHLLVALHHHPVAAGSAWIDALGLDNSPALFEALAGRGGVCTCVCGHIHQALQARHGDVLVLATPSTGTQFRPRQDTFAVDERPPGYRWLRLYDDGLVATAVQWV